MNDPRLLQIAWLARIALALVFIWHGLVPKILWLSPDELAMIQAHGLPAPEWVARIAGLAEITLGLLLLWRRQRWPLLLAAALLIGLLLDVALFSPHLLMQAFNTLSTNLAALALCWVAWRAQTP
ncbi:DoxX-like family protein [Pseudomonas sp. RL_15y_Pfl2_60]|uniref:DoxX-like family protein n=1 Tax=Pseudomonas sp. RL_15y_Pfl2_60 TaxID=3088709 RepID=UPI0030DDC268